MLASHLNDRIIRLLLSFGYHENRTKGVSEIKVGQEHVCLEFAPLLSIDYRFLSARWPRPKTLTLFFM